MTTGKITPQIVEIMKNLRKEGLTALEIGLKFGVVPSTVFYHTNESTREAQKIWNAKNEHKYKETRRKYKKRPDVIEANKKYSVDRRNTKVGRIGESYANMKKRNNAWLKAGDPRGIELMSKVSFERLFEEYVAKYGLVDFYYRTPLTFLQKKPNTLSIDRHDSTKGYTKNNTVFTSWETNNRKNAVTIQDSFIFVTRYLEVEHPEELIILLNLPGPVGDLFRRHVKTKVIDPLDKIQATGRMSFSQGGCVRGW